MVCSASTPARGRVGHVIRENEEQDRIEYHAGIRAMVDYLSEDRAVTDEGEDGTDRMTCPAGPRHRILNRQAIPAADRRVTMRTGFKTCTACGCEKPQDAFAPDPSKKSGYSAHCKECRSKRSRDYYLRNREKRIAWQKQYTATNRAKVNAYHRAYYAEHYEEHLARNRAYYHRKRAERLARAETPASPEISRGSSKIDD